MPSGPMPQMSSPFANATPAAPGNAQHVPPVAGGPAAGAEPNDGEAHRYPQGLTAAGGPAQPPAASGAPVVPGQKLIAPAGQPAPLPPGTPGAGPVSIQAINTAQQRNNRVAPVAKPQGLDPVILLGERENRFDMKL